MPTAGQPGTSGVHTALGRTDGIAIRGGFAARPQGVRALSSQVFEELERPEWPGNGNNCNHHRANPRVSSLLTQGCGGKHRSVQPGRTGEMK